MRSQAVVGMEIKMSNKDSADLLRSAASALEHGRYSTARRKTAESITPRLGGTVLDDSDIATILVALRHFQNDFGGMDIVQIADAWPDHFTVNGGDDDKLSDDERVSPMPLGLEEINDLCERINCSSILVVKS